MTQNESVTIELEEVRRLATLALERVGITVENTAAMTDIVVRAEADEAHSHGLYRILGCVAAVRSGKVDPRAVPAVIEQRGAVVRVDAKGGFAPAALALGRPLMVAAARRSGLAALAIHNCYHFSALWADIEEVARAGLVALSCTVGMQSVALAGGKAPALGTNPFAFAFPRGNGKEPFVFDLSTSTTARGEIELHRRAGTPIPAGWAIDALGHPTTDAEQALRGAILPLGGPKGTALGLMVELLAGPLLGELTSAQALAADTRDGGPLRGGYFMLALDPAFFGLAEGNMATADAWLTDLVKDHRPARLPGARRLAARARTRSDGVQVPASLFAELQTLAGLSP